MKHTVPKIGQLGITIIFTVASIFASILITHAILWITDASEEVLLISTVIATVAPALIAPVVVWYLTGLLIKIHKLEATQRKLATFDELTGLTTRRAFFELFEDLKDQSENHCKSLIFAYIDFDDFKKINDLKGHSAGDQVLKSFSEKLSKTVRSSDITGRIGGEEFAIVLPNIDKLDALKILERVRSFAKEDQVLINNELISYSISIGFTVMDKTNSSNVDLLVMQADKALYQAKHKGKDCIVEYA